MHNRAVTYENSNNSEQAFHDPKTLWLSDTTLGVHSKQLQTLLKRCIHSYGKARQREQPCHVRLQLMRANCGSFSKTHSLFIPDHVAQHLQVNFAVTHHQLLQALFRESWQRVWRYVKRFAQLPIDLLRSGSTFMYAKVSNAVDSEVTRVTDRLPDTTDLVLEVKTSLHEALQLPKKQIFRHLQIRLEP